MRETSRQNGCGCHVSAHQNSQSVSRGQKCGWPRSLGSNQIETVSLVTHLLQRHFLVEVDANPKKCQENDYVVGEYPLVTTYPEILQRAAKIESQNQNAIELQILQYLITKTVNIQAKANLKYATILTQIAGRCHCTELGTWFTQTTK